MKGLISHIPIPWIDRGQEVEERNPLAIGISLKHNAQRKKITQTRTLRIILHRIKLPLSDTTLKSPPPLRRSKRIKQNKQLETEQVERIINYVKREKNKS